MTATRIIHSARLVSGGVVTPDAWVVFAGDRVSAVGTGGGWRAHAPIPSETGPVSAARVAAVVLDIVDAGGRWLTPGFIDIHCHGGGGRSFEDGVTGIRTALAVHRAHGTTRSVLSLVTASQPDLESRLDVIAEVAEADPLVLGAHLEGPFLDEAFRGAHDRTLLQSVNSAVTDRLLVASRGYLRQITLAPELPGAMDAVARFVDAGVGVAIGHTAADYGTARAAFDAGASLLTHAFNAMPGIHHRAPGPVVAAMRSSAVTLEVINDGVHVLPEVVHLAFSGAPGRIALVTDAMAATGFGDGEYRLGTLTVTVTDGVARLAGGTSSVSGAIAGSTLTLDQALRRAVNEVGLSVADAVTALTETPARAVGRGHDLGQLAPGFAADAVLLAEDFTVEEVFAAGHRGTSNLTHR